jgi:exocyst complex component 4
LRQHEDGLNQVLRDTVPGLVQGVQDSAVQTNVTQSGMDDRLMGSEHHRSLVQSDAFHIGILFQPTFSFMERVVEVLPTGMEPTRSSTAILDDFVVDVYLPQLEEKTSYLFHQAVTGAFFQ